MCGRFAAQLPPSSSLACSTPTATSEPGPNWNVAPTQGAIVIRRHPEAPERRLDVLRANLDLLGHTMRLFDPNQKPATINLKRKRVGTAR